MACGLPRWCWSVALVLLLSAWSSATVMVESITPSAAGAAGGTSIVVHGTGFTDAGDILFCVLFFPEAGSFRTPIATKIQSDSIMTCDVQSDVFTVEVMGGQPTLEGSLYAATATQTYGARLPFRVFDLKVMELTALRPAQGDTTIATQLILQGTQLGNSSDAVCLVTSPKLALRLLAVFVGNSAYTCTLPAIASQLLRDNSQTATVQLQLTDQAVDRVWPVLPFVYETAAPTVNIVFDSAGRSLLVTWDFAVEPRFDDCSSVWRPGSLLSLGGAGATCTWLASHLLRVVPAADGMAKVQPSDSLSFLPETFGRQNHTFTRLYNQSFAIVAAAELVAKFSLSITGPTSVTMCAESLSANASVTFQALPIPVLGYGPHTFQWKLNTSNAPLASDETLSLLHSELALATSHALTVTATNVFGAQAFAQVVFTTSTNYFPVVTLVGGSLRTSQAVSALHLHATVSSPNEDLCGIRNVSEAYSFQWQLQNSTGSNVKLQPEWFFGSKLELPPGALQPDIYTATVTMFQASTTATAQVTQQLILSPTPLRVTLVGGNRKVGYQDQVRLDAGQSYDPDAAAHAVSFFWSCEVLDDELVPTGTPCAWALPNSTSPIFIFTPGAAEPGYYFTVVISRGTKTARVTTSIAVDVLNAKLPTLTGASETRLAAVQQQYAVYMVVHAASAATLRWTSVADPGFGTVVLEDPANVRSEIQWDLMPAGDMEGSQAGNDGYTETPAQLPLDTDTLVGLVLAPNVLQSDVTYKFALTASITGCTASSNAFVLVRGMALPGSAATSPLQVLFIQHPASHVASTFIRLMTSGFSASPGQGQLYYEFSFVDADGATYILETSVVPMTAPWPVPQGVVGVRVRVLDSMDNAEDAITLPISMANENRINSDVTAQWKDVQLHLQTRQSNSALASITLMLIHANHRRDSALAALRPHILFVLQTMLTEESRLVGRVAMALRLLAESAGYMTLTGMEATQLTVALAAVVQQNSTTFLQEVMQAIELIMAINVTTRVALGPKTTVPTLPEVLRAVGSVLCQHIEFGQQPIFVGTTALGLTVASLTGTADTLKAGGTNDNTLIILGPVARAQVTSEPTACINAILEDGNFAYPECQSERSCLQMISLGADVFSQPLALFGYTVNSPVLMINAWGPPRSSALLELRNLSHPLTLVIPVDAPRFGGIRRCVYWDPAAANWVSDGMDTSPLWYYRNQWAVNCSSNHATAFAVVEQCEPGWHGPLCAQVCPQGSFGQGCSGMVSCSGHGFNSPVTGGCDCQMPGFTGQFCNLTCDSAAGVTFSGTQGWGSNCSQACLCQNSGFCNATNGACSCIPGFTGNMCEINIDECEPEPCVYGNCSDGINSFSCNCSLGYNGMLCDENIDDCLLQSCGGGTCVDLVNDFECMCPSGLSGRFCTKPCTPDRFGPNCLQSCGCPNGCNAVSGDCQSSSNGSGVIASLTLFFLLLLSIAVGLLCMRHRNLRKLRINVAPEDMGRSPQFADAKTLEIFQIDTMTLSSNSGKPFVSGNLRLPPLQLSKAAVVASTTLETKIYLQNTQGRSQQLGTAPLAQDCLLQNLRDKLGQAFPKALHTTTFYFLDAEGEPLSLVRERSFLVSQVLVKESIQLAQPEYLGQACLDFCICARLATIMCQGCMKQGYCSSGCQQMHLSQGHNVACTASEPKKDNTSSAITKDNLPEQTWTAGLVVARGAENWCLPANGSPPIGDGLAPATSLAELVVGGEDEINSASMV